MIASNITVTGGAYIIITMGNNTQKGTGDTLYEQCMYIYVSYILK